MPLFRELLGMKAGSSAEMWLDVPKVSVDPGGAAGVGFTPPCEITDIVKFVNGVCPFSGHSDCRDCISNEFDAECIWLLLNSDKFGLS